MKGGLRITIRTKLPTAVLWLCLGLPCCRSISGTLRAPSATPPTGEFRAGSASVDLTPPPGISMGGHGSAGRIARGTWTRLYARALYLEDKDGSPLLLITCDLWAIPAGLADRVAELLGTSPPPVPISRNQLILAATHTHQGPANFSSSPVYNSLASPVIGFDKELFDFLSQRIASAGREAWRDAKPAVLSLRRERLNRLTQNRSFVAFVLNPEADELLLENPDLDDIMPSPDYRDRRAGKAVDGWANVLEAREKASNSLISLTVFLASHPTVMSHRTEVYNSDFFGVAISEIEAELKPENPKVVAAIVNGAEGDISPRWVNQDRQEALELGHALKEAVLKGTSTPVTVTGSISSKFALQPLKYQCPARPSPYAGCTAARASAGAPMLGGAEDGRTPEFDLGWKEGVRRERTVGQGSKQGALDSKILPKTKLTETVVELLKAPSVVPLGVYTVGPLVIATLPGEFTYTAGRRIRRALSASSGQPEEHVLLVGLANEYLSYFATPEEYDSQQYEGGSTGWGALSAPVVGQALVRLYQSGNSAPLPRDYRYVAGSSHDYSLANVGAEPARPDDGLSNILLDPVTGFPQRDCPRVSWSDRLPDLASGMVNPRAAMQQLQNGAWSPLLLDGRQEDDSGLDFVTVALEATKQSSRWVTFWMAPKGLVPDSTVRFILTTLSGEGLCSKPFKPYDSFDQGIEAYLAEPCP